MNPRHDEGMALLIVLLALLLLTTLGAGLVLITSSETIVARNFLVSTEAQYAADAAAERAMAELSTVGDWNAVLGGVLQSTFTDGPPGGTRLLADGSTLDLAAVVNAANCGRAGSCTAAEMDATTAERPWGSNNPRWQLYAHGWLRDLAPGRINSLYYIVALVGDDPGENDGNPLQDGVGTGNPGAGVLAVRALALGPHGARRAIELTLARQGGPRLLTWRSVP
jgi:hypothetical protein